MDLCTRFAAAGFEDHGDHGGVEAVVGSDSIPDGFERMGNTGSVLRHPSGPGQSIRNFIERVVRAKGAEGFEVGEKSRASEVRLVLVHETTKIGSCYIQRTTGHILSSPEI